MHLLFCPQEEHKGDRMICYARDPSTTAVSHMIEHNSSEVGYCPLDPWIPSQFGMSWLMNLELKKINYCTVVCRVAMGRVFLYDKHEEQQDMLDNN